MIRAFKAELCELTPCMRVVHFVPGLIYFVFNFFPRLAEFEELSSRSTELSECIKQKDDKISRLQER